MKNSKNFLFQKSKCTHVSSINLKGKVSDSKNIVTVLVYFCSYPCGTPCSCTLNYSLLWLHSILLSSILFLAQGADTFACSSRYYVPSFLPLKNKDFNLLIKIKFICNIFHTIYLEWPISLFSAGSGRKYNQFPTGIREIWIKMKKNLFFF